MRDENAHLRAVLRPVETAPSEDDLQLPARSGRAYAPHARPANKPLYSLHFLSPSGSVHSMQYAHLDSNSAYTAECITLRFLGMEPVKVTILGRGLWQLYDYIHQHRIAWVLQAARDFAEDGQAVITDIRFARAIMEE